MNRPTAPYKVLTFSVMPAETERELRERYHLLRWYDAGERSEIEKSLSQICAVITGGATGISSEWIARLPALNHIAVYGMGTDKVDLAAAGARNISISITPGVLTDDVADLGLSFILALMRSTVSGDNLIRSGEWAAGTKPQLSRSLKGARLGVLGMGGIGKALAIRAQACGMEISYWNRSKISEGDWTSRPSPLDLARHSDVLAICVAHTPDTLNIVDAAVIEALGTQGYLVNIARGGIVDEDALIAALENGRIAGAGLDVFSNEPNIRSEFTKLSNVLLTPHIGSATHQARLAMGRLVLHALDNIET